MPYSINGIGTTYYGKREEAADSSYGTTLWIILLFMPLLPIASYRVVETSESAMFSREYLIRRIPLCWPQVLNTYLVVASIILVWWVLIWLLDSS